MTRRILPNPDWCDPLVVELAVSEFRRPSRDLTPAERVAAVREARRQRLSTQEICRRIGLSGAKYRQIVEGMDAA